MGPISARPKALSVEEEGTCIGFRIHTMLPLDDCHYALQLMMPQLSRAGLHRLYQRHNISRLADIPGRIGDAETGIGSFYLDAADIRTGDGIATMLFAFDRTSKFAFAKLYERTAPTTAGAFLKGLADAVPYALTNVLSGENPLFLGGDARDVSSPSPFGAMCRQLRIAHTILPFDQPWRIRRESRDYSDGGAVAPRHYHYESHTHLRRHFRTFLETYNFERRLKTLGGLTPYEYICRSWRNNAGRFRSNPVRQRPEIEI